MSLRRWQAVVKADPAALDDFLAWCRDEQRRIAELALDAPSWDVLLALQGEKRMLDLAVSWFTLVDLEERQRAEYRRRNA